MAILIVKKLLVALCDCYSAIFWRGISVRKMSCRKRTRMESKEKAEEN